MRIRSENDPRYYRRYWILGTVLFGMALWFLFDAVYTYPAGRARGFQDFKAGDKTYFVDDLRKGMTIEEFDELDDPELKHQWEAFSHAGDIKGKPDILLQYILAGVSALVGAYLLSLPLRSRGRWIEASNTGITTSWGESFKFDEVESVNKRQWKKKGIAKVTYVANNTRRTFVVDDYKFERYPTDAILYQLEQQIDEGRITNGPPEPAPEGEVAAALQAAGKKPKS